jgi:hypothetical protein
MKKILYFIMLFLYLLGVLGGITSHGVYGNTSGGGLEDW